MTGAAVHYGDALFELAGAEGCDGRILEELDAVAALLRAEPAYLRVLDAPTLRREERCALLDEAVGGRVHPYLLNTLKLMAERGLAKGFFDAAAQYRKQYNGAHGILEARAVTAVPLSEGLRDRLAAALARATGKEIRLTCAVDGALLGGVRLELEGKELDGTVRHRLDALRRALLRAD